MSCHRAGERDMHCISLGMRAFAEQAILALLQ
jgi:hypothetical protein